MKRFPQIMVVLSALLLVPGCMLFGDDDGGVAVAPTPNPNVAKNKKKKKKSALSSITNETKWRYNKTGKRDPFMSFVQTAEVSDIQSPTPLQKYDIGKMVLVGTTLDSEGVVSTAIVVDPDNNPHIVKMGTYIGKNWGKVTDITARSIVITEEYKTIDGDLMAEQKVMSLPVDPNEMYEIWE